MKVNMLEAKKQLSRLVKEAMTGEEVVIASNGEPMVRLVPVEKWGGLVGYGKLKMFRGAVDDAFSPELDARIAGSLEGEREGCCSIRRWHRGGSPLVRGSRNSRGI